MSKKWEEISNRRLEVQHDTLVTLLQDGPDSRAQDPSQIYTKAVGEKPLPREVLNVLRAWEPGRNASISPSTGIEIRMFWDQNRLVYVGRGPHGPEYYIGHVKLSAGTQYTDVSIVCHEPLFRLYWIWLDKHLTLRYGQRSKGGPRRLPIEKQLEIVQRYHASVGKMRQVDFCALEGISENTLRAYEKNCTEARIAPKRRPPK